MIVDTGLDLNLIKKDYTICDRFKYMCYASEGNIMIFYGKAANTKWSRTVERGQYTNIPFRLQEKGYEFH